MLDRASVDKATLEWSGRIGVCSWSLRPRNAAGLVREVERVGVRRVQLALDPIRENRPGWGEIQTVNALQGAGIEVASGMMGTLGEDYSTLQSIARTGGVRPDATWGANLRAAEQNARLARRLGIRLVTFHAGFLPHEQDEERAKLVRRLRQVVDVFDDVGVRIAFETGQESAETLLEVLAEMERPHAGVNFDPANMILYGMGDPVDALARLGPRVAQVHIKDAIPGRPGEWGTEVSAGSGKVEWSKFFATLREIGFSGGLMVEREAGEMRVEDAVAARDLIRHQLGRLAGETGT